MGKVESWLDRVRRRADGACVIEARTVDVMFAGDRCALEFHGEGGCFIATLPLGVFIERARGERDGNGRAFPLAAPGEVPAPPSGRGRRGVLPLARVAAYVAARRDYEVAGLTRVAAARRHGLKENTFMGWLQKQRRAEGVSVAAGRGQFKPAEVGQ